MANRHCLRIQAAAIIAEPARLHPWRQGFFAPGEIVISEGQIVEVGARTGAIPDLLLENHALIPGLVNPHTHLEFSNLREPLPPQGDFPAWIESVLALRQSRMSEPNQELQAAIDRGLFESHRFGVSALADIVGPPWTAECLIDTDTSPGTWDLWPGQLQSQFPYDRWLDATAHFALPTPLVVACLEQVGLTSARHELAVAWRHAQLYGGLDDYPDQLHSLAISPHAPYSLRSSLMLDAIDTACRENRLAVMHLAESRAEREWIDLGTGPFIEFHAKLGVETVDRHPGMIIQCINALAKCPHALLIHGNYLTPFELDALSKRRDRISVVYCPRTHRHFQHDHYPLAEFSKRGIRVLYGTDSHSTNPDLNLWHEAQVAMQAHADLRPTDALSAITQWAADAIGMGDLCGSLTVGNSATICAVPLQRSVRQDEDIDEMLVQWFAETSHPIPLV